MNTKALNKKTAKGASWSLVSNVSIQAIQFLGGIIMARLLLPEDFGLVAMVLVIFRFANIISDLGFTKALIQKKDVTELQKSTVFWFNLALSIMLFVFFFIMAEKVGLFYNEPRVQNITKWLSLNFILTSFLVVPNSALIRSLDFKKITKIRVLSTVFSTLFAIGMALIGFGFWAIVAKNILSTLFLVIAFWIVVKWRPKLQFSTLEFKKLWAFGRNVSVSTIMTIINLEIERLVLGRYFDASTLGIYNRGMKYVKIPFTLGKGSLNKVLLSSFSRLQNDREAQWKQYLLYSELLLLVNIPISLLMFWTADEFIWILLGEKWMDSAFILKILSAGLIFQSLGFPNAYLTANNRTSRLLWLSVVPTAVRVVLIGFAVQTKDYTSIAYVSVIATVLNSITKNILSIEKKRFLVGFISQIWIYFLMGGITFVMMQFVNPYMDHSYYLGLILKSLLIVLSYFGMMFLLRRKKLQALFSKARTVFS